LLQETTGGYDFENRLKLKIDIAMKKIEEQAKREQEGVTVGIE
jgi:hypothetical protein